MTSDKKRRVTAAMGFLSGVVTCLDAVRDAKILWPPEALWAVLRRPQRLELGAGIALIVVTLIVSRVKSTSQN